MDRYQALQVHYAHEDGLVRIRTDYPASRYFTLNEALTDLEQIPPVNLLFSYREYVLRGEIRPETLQRVLAYPFEIGINVADGRIILKNGKKNSVIPSEDDSLIIIDANGDNNISIATHSHKRNSIDQSFYPGPSITDVLNSMLTKKTNGLVFDHGICIYKFEGTERDFRLKLLESYKGHGIKSQSDLELIDKKTNGKIVEEFIKKYVIKDFAAWDNPRDLERIINILFPREFLLN